jgi:hypothetical protein
MGWLRCGRLSLVLHNLYTELSCPQRHYLFEARWPGETPMLKFLASTVGIIFLIGLAVVIGLLMLIF